MSSMSMTSIWVFADFAAAKWGLAVLKGAESFILFVASHVDFLWILHSWSFMNPFWLYDFYVIFLHRGQLWKTLFFLSLWRRSHARSPESRSGGTWCDPELLKELPGNGVQTVSFLHFNMNMFSHASLSWILSSHFQYIIYISNMFKHLWIGLSKKD